MNRIAPCKTSVVVATYKTGAHMPPKGYHPAPPGALRRVLRAFDLTPETKVAYHIAYGIFTRR